MSAVIQFSLATEAIDVPALAAQLGDPAAGAVVTFEGRVRNHNAGEAVGQLEYQAYPALALPTGRRILEEETERHGLLGAVAVHRCGGLAIGEVAVWVGVSSAHRAAAFDAAQAIMERLKYELPVWKKETYVDGRTEWVGPDNTSAATGRVAEALPEFPVGTIFAAGTPMAAWTTGLARWTRSSASPAWGCGAIATSGLDRTSKAK
jgi:molybdopterin synthase catalytic subunit